jgi:membrane protease YdiL (CAAX protease family)
MAIGVGTGFCEEILYRGIVQNLMYDAFGRTSKKNVVVSIVISAIMFGCIHLFNYTATGWISLIQCLHAIGLGLFFGSIYARCNNIWAVIFLHGFWDVCGAVKSGFFGIGNIIESVQGSSELYAIGITIGIILLGLYVIWSLYLLRKEKEPEYIDKN